MVLGLEVGGRLGIAPEEVAGSHVAEPRRLGPANDWLSLRLGTTFGCGLRRGPPAVLECWGGGPARAATAEVAPTPVGEGFTALAAGDAHACAIRDGTLLCWGANDQGQCGSVPGDEPLLEPTRVTERDDWEAVGAGGAHTCAIRAGGEMWCWGANGEGQLGRGPGLEGDEPATHEPTPVRGDVPFRAVAGGRGHTCALSTEGAVYCWGDDAVRQSSGGVREIRLVPEITRLE